MKAATQWPKWIPSGPITKCKINPDGTRTKIGIIDNMTKAEIEQLILVQRKEATKKK
ncbi:hypothetical protein Droror1_Dr00020600, partial [Drosera rotundifolia]